MANTGLSFFSSSLGKKVIMALTGLFLCSFLIIHMVGNLQLFKDDGGLAFNIYAVFMTTNPLIKAVSYLLYAAILYHAFKGIYLAYENRKARPVAYAGGSSGSSSSWASRNMGILGTVLLVFIVVHMSGFWYEYKFGEVPYTQYTENLATGDVSAQAFTGTIKEKMEEYMIGSDQKVIVVKDLYKEVSLSFKSPVLVLFYVLAMFAVSFHLLHGFKSAFQSLGVNHKKYNGIIAAISLWVFAIIIPLGFAAMPIYFFLR